MPGVRGGEGKDDTGGTGGYPSACGRHNKHVSAQAQFSVDVVHSLHSMISFTTCCLGCLAFLANLR